MSRLAGFQLQSYTSAHGMLRSSGRHHFGAPVLRAAHPGTQPAGAGVGHTLSMVPPSAKYEQSISSWAGMMIIPPVAPLNISGNFWVTRDAEKRSAYFAHHAICGQGSHGWASAVSSVLSNVCTSRPASARLALGCPFAKRSFSNAAVGAIDNTSGTSGVGGGGKTGGKGGSLGLPLHFSQPSQLT